MARPNLAPNVPVAPLEAQALNSQKNGSETLEWFTNLLHKLPHRPLVQWYIYIYIYIYIKRGGSQVCSFSGWPLLGTLHHTFLLHCASSGGRTALSSNSIKQHRVPAWPVGRLMESQHGLLVVQGSISMACWSSQPSVPQHTQHSRGRTGSAACGSAQAPQASSGSPPR